MLIVLLVVLNLTLRPTLIKVEFENMYLEGMRIILNGMNYQ